MCPTLDDPESWENRICEFEMNGHPFNMVQPGSFGEWTKDKSIKKSVAKKPTGEDMAFFLLNRRFDETWKTMGDAPEAAVEQ